MIQRFLRRISVRRRIIGGFLVLVLLLTLATPLIVIQHDFLIDRVEQIADIEARTDRLLLLASTRVESSRVNLLRYIEDYTPSVNASLDDIDQAIQHLTDAQSLLTSPDQNAALTAVQQGLADYRMLVNDVATKRSSEDSQEVSRLLFQASRLGNDIGARIEQIVKDSEARVAAANETFRTEAQNRLFLLVSSYIGVLILTLVLAIVASRSITQPVAELRSATEAFRSGQMDITIPVTGTDELSMLAQTFNQLTAQLREMISSLEQRVAERTRDLHTAAEVARAITEVLDSSELLDQVVNLVLNRFDLYYVGLFLVDEARQFAVLQAGTGQAGHDMLTQGHKLSVGGSSMIGQCVARSQARIALDVGAEAVRFDNPFLPETRSELALPLRSRGRVIGAMTVQSEREAAFDKADIAVMQTMADQVAVAIENARLFAQTQATLKEAEATHQRYLVQEWTQYLKTLEKTGYETKQPGATSLDDTILPEIKRALEQQKATVIDNNVEQDRSALVAPISLRGGDFIGALGIHDDEARQWTQDEINLIETIAERLALAAENLRLFDEAQRRAAREQLLSKTMTQMRKTLEVDTVLQVAAREMHSALQLHDVIIQLEASNEHSQDNPS